MKKGQTLKGELEKIHGGPKQYQEGWTEFYKLKFYLTPDVLIPRPETELLVDEVLKLVNSGQVTGNSGKQNVSILEVGTGSGCIAISIAKNLSLCKVIAVEISEKALEVAKKNAKINKVADQIFFIKSDLLSLWSNSLVYHTKIPDIIVANLPYIPTARLMLTDPLVRDFEPKIALDGGRDGFELYRRLFTQIAGQLGVGNLKPKYLMVEIGEDQGELALAEARKYFPNSKAEIKKDLAKKDRILIVNF